jgi:hypothetical protein
MASLLAIVPNVRVFKPDRGRWIFKNDNNSQHAFLSRESKTIGTMS